MSASILRTVTASTVTASAVLIALTCLATPMPAAAKSRPAVSKTVKDPAPMFSSERQTEHRGEHDDLLTAGLGLNGLRAMVAPAFADPAHPTPQELRRRALWTNWRGIADLAPGGGYGELYGSTANVPGREFSAFATVPGAKQPHRVLAQVPDSFDLKKRCIVVSASSGSRGIYGSIAVAGAWGLPKGCAVAYTDKGAGTDYFDLDAGLGVRADGTVGSPDDGDLAFLPDAEQRKNAHGVAFKHAHSGDNPEADWGRHVHQAAEFALSALDRAFPKKAPFTFANTRVIAVGISNGGGAVLRAAELSGEDGKGWLDAVVAGEPNVYVEGARPLYDYVTEAAVVMPCALLHKPLGAMPVVPFGSDPARGYCDVAVTKHFLGPDAEADVQPMTDMSREELGRAFDALEAARAKRAYEHMRDKGWSDEALRAGALSVNFDLWSAVAATYASAYARAAPADNSDGADQPWPRYAYAAGTPEPPSDYRPKGGRPLQEGVASAELRAAWWSDASGIPPGAGVYLFPTMTNRMNTDVYAMADLRLLWIGVDANDSGRWPENKVLLSERHRRLRAGIEQTRASAPRKDLPIVVVHGLDDGLIPPAFSSAPYAAMARKGGAKLSYWQVKNVQHFDAFLGLPALSSRYLPLLPYVYTALDRVDAYLDSGAALPGDAVIETTPRAQGQGLKAENLAIPK